MLLTMELPLINSQLFLRWKPSLTVLSQAMERVDLCMTSQVGEKLSLGAECCLTMPARMIGHGDKVWHYEAWLYRDCCVLGILTTSK